MEVLLFMLGLTSFIPFLGLIPSILAVVFGAVYFPELTELSLAGFILGIIGLIEQIIVFILAARY